MSKRGRAPNLRMTVVNQLTLWKVPFKYYQWMCPTIPIWECKHEACKPRVANPAGDCLWEAYDIRPYV